MAETKCNELIPLEGPLFGCDTFIAASSNPADLFDTADDILATLELLFTSDNPQASRSFGPHAVGSMWRMIATARSLVNTGLELQRTRSGRA